MNISGLYTLHCNMEWGVLLFLPRWTSTQEETAPQWVHLRCPSHPVHRAVYVRYPKSQAGGELKREGSLSTWWRPAYTIHPLSYLFIHLPSKPFIGHFLSFILSWPIFSVCRLWKRYHLCVIFSCSETHTHKWCQNLPGSFFYIIWSQVKNKC